MVNHEVLLPVLSNHFGIDGKAIKWFENLGPGILKYCINGHYSSSKELKFSIHQGSCSGASVFTCYCALITDIIPNTITISRFADDHLIRKKYRASHRNQEIRTNEELETTGKNIKNWIDAMHLKLNSDKTEYIKFRSKQQLNAYGNLVNLSKVVRYLGGHLDQTPSFKKHIKQKTKKAKANFIKIKQGQTSLK